MAATFTEILAGGFIGSIITHALALWRDQVNDRRARARERMNRLNAFRGWLTHWRCRFYRHPDVLQYYDSVVDDIARECGLIFEDLKDLTDMPELLWTTYSFRATDLQTDGRDKLIHHIEDLLGRLPKNY